MLGRAVKRYVEAVLSFFGSELALLRGCGCGTGQGWAGLFGKGGQVDYVSGGRAGSSDHKRLLAVLALRHGAQSEWEKGKGNRVVREIAGTEKSTIPLLLYRNCRSAHGLRVAGSFV